MQDRDLGPTLLKIGKDLSGQNCNSLNLARRLKAILPLIQSNDPLEQKIALSICGFNEIKTLRTEAEGLKQSLKLIISINDWERLFSSLPKNRRKKTFTVPSSFLSS
jgi:hypothetical protein